MADVLECALIKTALSNTFSSVSFVTWLGCSLSILKQHWIESESFWIPYHIGDKFIFSDIYYLGREIKDLLDLQLNKLGYFTPALDPNWNWPSEPEPSGVSPSCLAYWATALDSESWTLQLCISLMLYWLIELLHCQVKIVQGTWWDCLKCCKSRAKAWGSQVFH